MAREGYLGVHLSRDPALRLSWLWLSVKSSVSRDGFYRQ